MAKNVRDTLIANGVEEDQADLIAEAFELARDKGRRVNFFDTPALRSVRRTFFATSDTTGKDFREFQSIVTKELRGLTAREVAFGDIPDDCREQYSAFCWAMYRGHQERYLDRHEDEDPAEFLNRSQKRTLNLTRLVINVLSKLYHAPPARDHKSTTEEVEADGSKQEVEIFATPEHIRDRLDEIWAGELFNRSMQEVDIRCRLMGTVAVRPMYDPTLPGSIRLWLYMSHQLRVIPNPAAPWKPAAVIERVHPFGKEKSITIWTDTWFIDLRKKGEVIAERHGLGRIPHVFCRDQLSYTSFFVEGRGRILCNPNAILNNDLSDLEEIKQMQGFSLLELVNPANDKQRVGPRETAVFRPPDKDTPFGARFLSPNAPLEQLRADISDQIQQTLTTNNVPAAALGAEINKRTLSGAAIRAAMQPIVSDNEQRESLFKPIEHDLADSMLRIVRRHEPAFAYVPETQRPEFVVKYQALEFPLDTRDQVIKDDFDIAQAINTPAGVMRRDNPEEFETHDDAVSQWQDNLAELRTAGFTPGDDEPDLSLRASYGGFNPSAERDVVDAYDAEDLLDDLGLADVTPAAPSGSSNAPALEPQPATDQGR